MGQGKYYQQNESRIKVGQKHSLGSGKLKIERIGGSEKYCFESSLVVSA